MQEFEAHFLEIDVEKIQSKLESLSAKKISDSILQEMIFDKPDRSWNKIQKRIRIRTNGNKTQLSYKEQSDKNKIGGTSELETVTSDLNNTRLILEKLGMIMVRQQEKRRITYELGDVVFDIDFWPKIPPYLEVESISEEKVREASEKLGLVWTDATFWDAKQIYEDVYNIKPLDDVKILTFEKIEFRQ